MTFLKLMAAFGIAGVISFASFVWGPHFFYSALHLKPSDQVLALLLTGVCIFSPWPAIPVADLFIGIFPTMDITEPLPLGPILGDGKADSDATPQLPPPSFEEPQPAAIQEQAPYSEGLYAPGSEEPITLEQQREDLDPRDRKLLGILEQGIETGGVNVKKTYKVNGKASVTRIGAMGIEETFEVEGTDKPFVAQEEATEESSTEAMPQMVEVEVEEEAPKA